MTPFIYPNAPHVRLHGPEGYVAYEPYRPWLRDEFIFRCVYCLKRERWGTASGEFHLDHFLPQIKDPGRILEYDNLLYSCVTCNVAKGAEIIPDPCNCMLAGQVVVHEDGNIEAMSDESAKLIRVLGLDSPEYCEFRQLWIGIVQLAKAKDTKLFQKMMKYPDELPNLAVLRPRRNSRPNGVSESCFAMRERGELPDTY